MTKQRQRYVAASVCFFLALWLLYTELRHHSLGLHGSSRQVLPATGQSFQLQFPASFPGDVSKRELIKNTHAFKSTGRRYLRVTGLRKQEGTRPWHPGRWSTAVLRLFAAADIGSDPRRCGEALAANALVAVAPKQNLNADLAALVGRVIAEIDRGRDAYLREFQRYLDPQIRLQAHLGVVDRHWFHMAGSSVYLAEYGYHMMVSRVAYSPDGLRNNPQFSFAYLQLFDTAWNEVRDVALVVPTNMGDGDRFFSVHGRKYTVVHFPGILHVPFYHDPENPGMKYLGPEDARVVLVQNKAGFEEPLLVYNCQHQKEILLDDDDDDAVLKQMAFFRLIFVCWPWQFQYGKRAVEDTPNELFDSQLYSRVKELEIKNSRREKTQKNWTPLISESARAETGFDSHLYFVYRWAHLQILRCDITSEQGKCGFVYSARENLKITSNIGPLRGGTPMVQLNAVLAGASPDLLASVMPPNREVWVGFARAHLHKCGCGKEFYRPNLVVLVRDSSGMGESRFTLSHMSSFSSLGVDVIPWNPLRPLDVCQGTNAIIPNGISAWQVRHAKTTGLGWEIDDLLSLSLSVSDCTVDIVHIHGLLEALVNLPDHSLFLPMNVDEKDRKEALDKLQQKSSREPSNDNLICALEESSNYCEYYGIDVNERLAMASIYEDGYESEPEDEQLELYRYALEELGLE